MFKNICKRLFTSNNISQPLPKIRSVLNVDREDYYPFLHPIVQGYLPTFKKSQSSYAIVYPKDISDFLKKQEDLLRYTTNIEVKFINEISITSGRSNVGKSSLINTILDKKQTKISKTPGKTNYLQFIHLEDAGVSLVDCPGYGYANRSQKERNEWNKMMEQYFVENHLLFILVDSEVGVGELDENCMKMCSFSRIEFNVKKRFINITDR